MKRSNPVLRAVSILLLQTFIAQQFSYAEGITPSKKLLFEKPRVDLALPASVAVVEDAYRGTSDKTVYLLQDAHTNPSGQLNIARSLDFILEKEKDLRFVFTEAGVENNSLSSLRANRPLAERQTMALSYIKQGLLHGTEYLDLTSERDFTIWGVEDPTLYVRSLENYKAVAKDRERFELYLKKIDSTLGTLKGRLLGPGLAQFDAEMRKYEQGTLTLTQYFSALSREAGIHAIDLTKYPQLQNLETLQSQEEKIDLAKANEEQIKALQSLPMVVQDELKDASESQKNSPFKIGSVDSKEGKAFYTLLEEKLGGRCREFPELCKYFEYVKLARQIEAKHVLDELKALEKEIIDTLCRTEDEKMLMHSQAVLRHLEKLFRFALTPQEFAEYKELTLGFGIEHLTGFLNKKIMDLGSYHERALFLEKGYEDVTKRAEEFYTLTTQRDEYFVSQMLAKMDAESQKTSALVTGGFHSVNLKALLKQKGISFVSITPQVLQETNVTRYENILLNQTFSTPTKPSLALMAMNTVSAINDGRGLPVFVGARTALENIANGSPLIAGARAAEPAKLASQKKIAASVKAAVKSFQAGEGKRKKGEEGSHLVSVTFNKSSALVESIIMVFGRKWFARGFKDPKPGSIRYSGEIDLSGRLRLEFREEPTNEVDLLMAKAFKTKFPDPVFNAHLEKAIVEYNKTVRNKPNQRERFEDYLDKQRKKRTGRPAPPRRRGSDSARIPTGGMQPYVVSDGFFKPLPEHVKAAASKAFSAYLDKNRKPTKTRTSGARAAEIAEQLKSIHSKPLQDLSRRDLEKLIDTADVVDGRGLWYAQSRKRKDKATSHLYSNFLLKAGEYDYYILIKLGEDSVINMQVTKIPKFKNALSSSFTWSLDPDRSPGFDRLESRLMDRRKELEILNGPSRTSALERNAESTERAILQRLEELRQQKKTPLYVQFPVGNDEWNIPRGVEIVWSRSNLSTIAQRIRTQMRGLDARDHHDRLEFILARDASKNSHVLYIIPSGARVSKKGISDTAVTFTHESHGAVKGTEHYRLKVGEKEFISLKDVTSHSLSAWWKRLVPATTLTFFRGDMDQLRVLRDGRQIRVAQLSDANDLRLTIEEMNKEIPMSLKMTAGKAGDGVYADFQVWYEPVRGILEVRSSAHYFANHVQDAFQLNVTGLAKSDIEAVGRVLKASDPINFNLNIVQTLVRGELQSRQKTALGSESQTVMTAAQAVREILFFARGAARQGGGWIILRNLSPASRYDVQFYGKMIYQLDIEDRSARVEPTGVATVNISKNTAGIFRFFKRFFESVRAPYLIVERSESGRDITVTLPSIAVDDSAAGARVSVIGTIQGWLRNIRHRIEMFRLFWKEMGDEDRGPDLMEGVSRVHALRADARHLADKTAADFPQEHPLAGRTVSAEWAGISSGNAENHDLWNVRVYVKGSLDSNNWFTARSVPSKRGMGLADGQHKIAQTVVANLTKELFDTDADAAIRDIVSKIQVTAGARTATTDRAINIQRLLYPIIVALLVKMAQERPFSNNRSHLIKIGNFSPPSDLKKWISLSFPHVLMQPEMEKAVLAYPGLLFDLVAYSDDYAEILLPYFELIDLDRYTDGLIRRDFQIDAGGHSIIDKPLQILLFQHALRSLPETAKDELRKLAGKSYWFTLLSLSSAHHHHKEMTRIMNDHGIVFDLHKAPYVADVLIGSGYDHSEDRLIRPLAEFVSRTLNEKPATAGARAVMIKGVSIVGDEAQITLIGERDKKDEEKAGFERRVVRKSLHGVPTDADSLLPEFEVAFGLNPPKSFEDAEALIAEILGARVTGKFIVKGLRFTEVPADASQGDDVLRKAFDLSAEDLARIKEEALKQLGADEFSGGVVFELPGDGTMIWLAPYAFRGGDLSYLAAINLRTGRLIPRFTHHSIDRALFSAAGHSVVGVDSFRPDEVYLTIEDDHSIDYYSLTAKAMSEDVERRLTKPRKTDGARLETKATPMLKARIYSIAQKIQKIYDANPRSWGVGMDSLEGIIKALRTDAAAGDLLTEKTLKLINHVAEYYDNTAGFTSHPEKRAEFDSIIQLIVASQGIDPLVEAYNILLQEYKSQPRLTLTEGQMRAVTHLAPDDNKIVLDRLLEDKVLIVRQRDPRLEAGGANQYVIVNFAGARLHLPVWLKTYLQSLKIIAFVSPPWAGKGAQISWLAEELGFEKLEMGELIRGAFRFNKGAVVEGSAEYEEFGKIAKLISEEEYQLMMIGKMMSDETALAIVNEALSWPRYKNALGVILDGYPRNILQWRGISDVKWKDESIQVGLYVGIEVPESTLVQRSANVRGDRPDDGTTARRLQEFKDTTERLMADLKIRSDNYVTFNGDNKPGTRDESILAVREQELIPALEAYYQKIDTQRRYKEHIAYVMNDAPIKQGSGLNGSRLLRLVADVNHAATDNGHVGGSPNDLGLLKMILKDHDDISPADRAKFMSEYDLNVLKPYAKPATQNTPWLRKGTIFFGRDGSVGYVVEEHGLDTVAMVHVNGVASLKTFPDTKEILKNTESVLDQDTIKQISSLLEEFRVFGIRFYRGTPDFSQAKEGLWLRKGIDEEMSLAPITDLNDLPRSEQSELGLIKLTGISEISGPKYIAMREMGGLRQPVLIKRFVDPSDRRYITRLNNNAQALTGLGVGPELLSVEARQDGTFTGFAFQIFDGTTLLELPKRGVSGNADELRRRLELIGASPMADLMVSRDRRDYGVVDGGHLHNVYGQLDDFSKPYNALVAEQTVSKGARVTDPNVRWYMVVSDVLSAVNGDNAPFADVQGQALVDLTNVRRKTIVDRIVDVRRNRQSGTDLMPVAEAAYKKYYAQHFRPEDKPGVPTPEITTEIPLDLKRELNLLRTRVNAQAPTEQVVVGARVPVTTDRGGLIDTIDTTAQSIAQERASLATTTQIRALFLGQAIASAPFKSGRRLSDGSLGQRAYEQIQRKLQPDDKIQVSFDGKDIVINVPTIERPVGTSSPVARLALPTTASTRSALMTRLAPDTLESLARRNGARLEIENVLATHGAEARFRAETSFDDLAVDLAAEHPSLESMIDFFRPVAVANAARLPEEGEMTLLFSTNDLGRYSVRLEGENVIVAESEGSRVTFPVKKAVVDAPSQDTVAVNAGISDMVSAVRQRRVVMGGRISEIPNLNTEVPVSLVWDPTLLFSDDPSNTSHFDALVGEALVRKHGARFAIVLDPSADPRLLQAAGSRIEQLKTLYPRLSRKLSAIFLAAAITGSMIVNVGRADASVSPQLGQRFIPVAAAQPDELPDYPLDLLIASGQISLEKDKLLDPNFKEVFRMATGDTVEIEDGELRSVLDGTAPVGTRVAYGIKPLFKAMLQEIHQVAKNLLALGTFA